MSKGESCANHPDRRAISFCHVCGKPLCAECLIEGPEYYYCKSERCQRMCAQAVASQQSSEASSACPIPLEEKVWVERSFLWLIEQFGADALRSVSVVTPTREFFPQAYDGSDEAAEGIIHAVCRYMRIDAGRLDYLFCQDHVPASDLVPVYESSHEGSAGLFYRPSASDKIILGLEMSSLDAPERLVAATAHELAHVHLLADHRLSGGESDHEQLADLLTVFFGLGVFTANAAFQFSQWEAGLRQGWRASKMGYLSEATYGHALAAFCWLRQELKPPWSRYLASNIEHYRKRSMKYLKEARGGGLPIVGRA